MLNRAHAKYGKDVCICLDDKKYNIGDQLPSSKQWEDILDGTSVIGYTIQSHHTYCHTYAYVARGDGYASGHDDGELVCLGAKVTDVL